ncbi:MAG: CDP-diacylglycerol--glycerol-3-phosphate 3-phosphatidyltransferase [Acidimicrobiaceae bacterium]|nr:CDP-diacylglycerol--glycerol-3-phosphate 3-phosphatidyltransferase [Acidimicrobiaceae bacterium]
MPSRIDGKFEHSALVTPANGITLIRVLATPLMLILILDLGPSWAAVVAWVALSSTDFLDGWVARRQGVTSSGAFLDPLADKILVLGALAALAGSGLVSWWPVALIAARELAISAYRSVVARRGISVPARRLAKAKTAVQDLAISLVLLPPTGLHHLWIGRTLLWVAVALALVSGAQYLLDGRPHPAAGGAAGKQLGS